MNAPGVTPSASTLGVWYLALGLVLAPAGIVVAWTHLTVEGPTAVAGLGIVAAVAGAGCLWRSLRVIRPRLRPRWRILPAALTALVVAYAWVLPWSVAVYATVPPRPGADERAPTVDGERPDPVRFDTPGAVRLAGWYLEGTGDATVVLLPGSSATTHDVVPQAAELHRAGFSVLAYDARGHGRSGGRAMELGWDAELDVAAAVTYLIDERDSDPDRIGVMGLSLGGEVAIGAAAADGRIAAVVAEGATGRSAADHEWLPDDYGFRGEVQLAVDRFTYWLVDLLSPVDGPPAPMRDAVQNLDGRPLLMVAAGRRPDEGSTADRLHEAAPADIDVWHVAGADHTGSLRTDPAGWRRVVVGFLRDELDDRGSPG